MDVFNLTKAQELLNIEKDNHKLSLQTIEEYINSQTQRYVKEEIQAYKQQLFSNKNK